MIYGNICFVNNLYIALLPQRSINLGIVKIADELHEEIRKASGAMSRSINAQAEFWLKWACWPSYTQHIIISNWC